MDRHTFEGALRAIDLYEHCQNAHRNITAPALHQTSDNYFQADHRPDLLLERLPIAHSIEPALLQDALEKLIRDPDVAAKACKDALTAAHRYQGYAVVAQQKLDLSHSDFVQLTEVLSVDQLYGWATKPEELQIPSASVKDLLMKSVSAESFDADRTEQLLKRLSTFIHQLSPLESIAFDISSNQLPTNSISETILNDWEQHCATLRADPEYQNEIQRYAAWRIVTALLKKRLGPCQDASAAGLLLAFAVGSPPESLIKDGEKIDVYFYSRSFVSLQEKLLPRETPHESIIISAIDDALHSLTESRMLVKQRGAFRGKSDYYDPTPAVPSIPCWPKITSIIKALRSSSSNLEKLLCTTAASLAEPPQKPVKPKIRSSKENSKEVAKCLQSLEQIEQYIGDLLIQESPQAYTAGAARISSAAGQMRKTLSGLSPAANAPLSCADVVAAASLLKPPNSFDRLTLCDYTTQSAMAIAVIRNHVYLVVAGSGGT